MSTIKESDVDHEVIGEDRTRYLAYTDHLINRGVQLSFLVRG